ADVPKRRDVAPLDQGVEHLVSVEQAQPPVLEDPLRPFRGREVHDMEVLASHLYERVLFRSWHRDLANALPRDAVASPELKAAAFFQSPQGEARQPSGDIEVVLDDDEVGRDALAGLEIGR